MRFAGGAAAFRRPPGSPPGSISLALRVVVVEAPDQDRAAEHVSRDALALFPPSDGWSVTTAAAVPIEDPAPERP